MPGSPGEPMYPPRVPLAGGYPPPYWAQPPSRAPRNDMGTASLWLGICAAVLFWLPTVGFGLGIAATATGIAGWVRVRRGRATNISATITGIVLGIVVSIVGALILAVLLYLFISYQNCIDHAEGRAEYAKC